MTVEAVMSRIAALQSLMAGQPTVAPTSSSGDAPVAGETGANTASFAAALAQASATGLASPLATTSPIAGAAAPTASAPTASADGPLSSQIQAAAARYSLDPKLLSALVQQESGGNPNARSAAGALGLTQLMPATAASLGVTDPLDPVQSLDGGAKYLRQQLDHFGGDVAKALAAYNAGPGAVERFGGVPPYTETQNYVRSILARMSS